MIKGFGGGLPAEYLPGPAIGLCCHSCEVFWSEDGQVRALGEVRPRCQGEWGSRECRRRCRLICSGLQHSSSRAGTNLWSHRLDATFRGLGRDGLSHELADEQ